MITQKDQFSLLSLIAKEIKKDIACYAFGGNAMMFYGFKEDTKDIDLIFDEESAREEFIAALVNLGFSSFSPITIYIPEKLRDKSKPLMFRKGGEFRFDLFVKKVFRTFLSPSMRENPFAVHDFRERHTLRVNVLKTEAIVLLKAITERDKDFEDILTIIKNDKNFNWQYLVDEALWQHQHGDSWVLIDLERTIRELQKYVFIEQKYLRQIYLAQEKGMKRNQRNKTSKK